MRMRTIGHAQVLWILVLLAAIGQLSAASISATVSMGQNYCRVVSFPRGWKIAPMMKKSGFDHFEFGPDKLEFRATESDTTELLVGMYADYGPRTRPGDYSPDRYWVDMRHGGRARPATEEEWNAGFRLGALSKPFLNGALMPRPPMDDEDLVLHGSSFKKSGALWATDFYLTRVSQDGQWLMVQSANGTRKEKRGGGNGDWVVRDDLFIPHHGTFFMDIYNFKTAQKAIAIRVSIRGDEDSPGDHAMWLQSRYFVVPTQEHFKELLVCDMKDLLPEEKKLR